MQESKQELVGMQKRESRQHNKSEVKSRGNNNRVRRNNQQSGRTRLTTGKATRPRMSRRRREVKVGASVELRGRGKHLVTNRSQRKSRSCDLDVEEEVNADAERGVEAHTQAETESIMRRRSR